MRAAMRAGPSVYVLDFHSSAAFLLFAFLRERVYSRVLDTHSPSPNTRHLVPARRLSYLSFVSPGPGESTVLV